MGRVHIRPGRPCVPLSYLSSGAHVQANPVHARAADIVQDFDIFYSRAAERGSYHGFDHVYIRLHIHESFRERQNGRVIDLRFQFPDVLACFQYIVAILHRRKLQWHHARLRSHLSTVQPSAWWCD